MHPVLNSLVRPAVAGAVAAFLFAGAFLAALHAPAPRGLQVGVVGPPGAAQQIAAAVDRTAPGAFDIRSVAGAAAARDAVAGRDLHGALVLGPKGPALMVAGANGALATQTLRTAFGRAAGVASPSPAAGLAVRDVAPLPPEDRGGASAFFLVVATLIAALLGGALVALRGRGPLRERASGLVAMALAVGATTTAVATWIVDALPGAPLALLAITVALALAVGATVLGAVRLAGPAGMGLTALAFIALGVAAAGGPFGSAFVPEPFATLGGILPLGVAGEAVRGAVYFDGAGVENALAVLGVWTAVGFAAAAVPAFAGVAAPWRLRRRAAA